MKTLASNTILALAALNFSATMGFALTPLSDNFNATTLNKRWKLTSFGNGKLSQKESALNFTVEPSANEGDSAEARLLNNQPGYNENWQVIVDVTNTMAKGYGAGVFLGVFDADAPSHYARIGFYGKKVLGNGPQGPNTRISGGFSIYASDLVSSFSGLNPDISKSSLRITFNKNTKLLTFYCDKTGPADGLQWTEVGSFSTNGVGGDQRSNWKMNPGGGRFGIKLEADGESLIIPNGKMTFDNFVLKANP